MKQKIYIYSLVAAAIGMIIYGIHFGLYDTFGGYAYRRDQNWIACTFIGLCIGLKSAKCSGAQIIKIFSRLVLVLLIFNIARSIGEAMFYTSELNEFPKLFYYGFIGKL